MLVIISSTFCAQIDCCPPDPPERRRATLLAFSNLDKIVDNTVQDPKVGRFVQGTYFGRTIFRLQQIRIKRVVSITFDVTQNISRSFIGNVVVSLESDDNRKWVFISTERL